MCVCVCLCVHVRLCVCARACALHWPANPSSAHSQVMQTCYYCGCSACAVSVITIRVVCRDVTVMRVIHSACRHLCLFHSCCSICSLVRPTRHAHLAMCGCMLCERLLSVHVRSASRCGFGAVFFLLAVLFCWFGACTDCGPAFFLFWVTLICSSNHLFILSAHSLLHCFER